MSWGQGTRRSREKNDETDRCVGAVRGGMQVGAAGCDFWRSSGRMTEEQGRRRRRRRRDRRGWRHDERGGGTTGGGGGTIGGGVGTRRRRRHDRRRWRHDRRRWRQTGGGGGTTGGGSGGTVGLVRATPMRPLLSSVSPLWRNQRGRQLWSCELRCVVHAPSSAKFHPFSITEG